MLEYEPIDLSPFCNAGPEMIKCDCQPRIGAQTFQGLPFEIGGEGARCFIAFGPDLVSKPVRVPIEKPANWVIFAHRIFNSRLHEGDPPGRVYASYAFVYENGERVTTPIRERFEAGDIPPGWGELPFIAVPDEKDGVRNDRYRGDWGSAGFRQTEASQALPRDYYLWAWQNPRPDRRIDHIEILPGAGDESKTPGFLIAAITLSHLEESPFCQSAAVPVKLTLPRPEDAAGPFGLEIEVDRGSATYPFPLPGQPDDAFLNDPFRGWGEAYNKSNSPAYVEIAANPSATVSVRREGEELGQALWSELESG
ncbi:MAG TPA: hypothetical protein VFJ58_28350, partial [Armatimonadota bacterium]|nr:hypothetical protein [Armatimonadota bacterium]